MNLSPLWRGRAALAKLDSIPQSVGLSLTLDDECQTKLSAVPPPSAWLASRARAREGVLCVNLAPRFEKRSSDYLFPNGSPSDGRRRRTQKESYSTASCLFSCLSHSQVGTPLEYFVADWSCTRACCQRGLYEAVAPSSSCSPLAPPLSNSCWAHTPRARPSRSHWLCTSY